MKYIGTDLRYCVLDFFVLRWVFSDCSKNVIPPNKKFVYKLYILSLTLEKSRVFYYGYYSYPVVTCFGLFGTMGMTKLSPRFTLMVDSLPKPLPVLPFRFFTGPRW